ncbi:MAG: sulfotransferase [Actinomycetota bacterium]|nr:sulfotransferase [Actinomycetota bacterium]
MLGGPSFEQLRGMLVSPAHRAILVSGMPRSGTTWLARLLASAPGTALAGREPMNPRGRQWGLAHTLTGWTEMVEVTTTQRLALLAAYHGLSPWAFSRYGRRQWAAPLPWTRVVVKDPFAMLSIPAVVRVTGAVPILLYRHPGAGLASYRRMGWKPDLDELRPVLAEHRRARSVLAPGSVQLPRPGEAGEAGEAREAHAMGAFWSALYEIALDNLTPDTVVVSHEELVVNGSSAARMLFTTVGLEWNAAAEAQLGGQVTEHSSAQAGTSLHNFDRDPQDVVASWRKGLTEQERVAVETVTSAVQQRLHEARLVLA